MKDTAEREPDKLAGISRRFVVVDFIMPAETSFKAPTGEKGGGRRWREKEIIQGSRNQMSPEVSKEPLQICSYRTEKKKRTQEH